MRQFTTILLTGLLAALALAPSASAAKYKAAVAVTDQSPSLFTQPSFKALKVKKSRYFIRWNTGLNKTALQKGDLKRADEFVAAARKAHVRVLMHISTDNLTAKKAKLPSVKQYKSAVGKLVRRYKAKGVKDWGTWNEANHKTQPTYKSPKRAAQFFLALRGMCKGCTIIALDALDQAGVDRYIKSFFKTLGRKNYSKAKIIGIHTYSDTNRFRSSGTAKILKTVKKYNKKADFWLTETGGLYAFGGAFGCDATRQVKATKYMFTLLKKYRKDITRLYAYNYFGLPEAANCALAKPGFDAGLVDNNGTPRPAYATFKKEAASFAR
jgi:hypothetical protein